MRKWSGWMGLSFALLGAVSASGPAHAQVPTQVPTQWAVQTLDRPGAIGTQLWGINDAGVVVGSDSQGTFSYSAGVYTALSLMPNATAMTAFGVADNGTIVGSWTETVDASTSILHGFIDRNGIYTTWDVPAAVGSSTQIRSISLDGRYLAGYYATASSVQQGFIYDLQTSTLRSFQTVQQMNLQGVNASGVTVGSLGGQNGGGVVVAAGATTYSVQTTLPDVAGRPSFRGINDSGLVTGFTNAGLAIVGRPDSNSFVALGVDGAASVFGEGLNNANAVVGLYQDANNDIHGFLATPVPEAPTALLMAAGLAGVGLLRRRRVVGSGA